MWSVVWPCDAGRCGAATIRGRGAATFPIQVWAAKEIPASLSSLGGLSGGPAFDETGRVIGVTIAESPRRGRVATTQARLSSEMIDLAGVSRQFSIDARNADPVPNLTPSTYREKGDALRAAEGNATALTALVRRFD